MDINEKYYVGIDIGGTEIKSCIAKITGEIIVKHKIKVNAHIGRIGVLDQIEKLIFKLLEMSKLEYNQISGIGVGVPGPVNSETGVIEKLMHIYEFNNFNIKNALMERFNIPINIGNDANFAALGELKFGKISEKPYAHILFLTIGTGIGAGIISNGKLVTGRGGAGEVGCMKISTSGHKYCACGQYDCWHAYCSSAALIREAKVRLCLTKDTIIWEKCGKNFSNVNAEQIFDAAREGDYFAEQLIKYEIKYLAKGMSSLINIFDPEILIIGGGMSLAGDILFKGLKKEMSLSTREKAYENLKLIPSSLGNKAGILGAVASFI